jgi:hypothetical protein
MSYSELTAFDGEIEIYFHLDNETGEVLDCYTYSRHIDDEHLGLKKKFFELKTGALFTYAKAESIPYLWRKWRKWVSKEDRKEFLSLAKSLGKKSPWSAK